MTANSWVCCIKNTFRKKLNIECILFFYTCMYRDRDCQEVSEKSIYYLGYVIFVFLCHKSTDSLVTPPPPQHSPPLQTSISWLLRWSVIDWHRFANHPALPPPPREWCSQVNLALAIRICCPTRGKCAVTACGEVGGGVGSPLAGFPPNKEI